MKREICKKLSCILLAGIVLAGCGEKKVSDDMTTEEAIQYAEGLLEENKDSSAEDLNDDMVDDAIADFMGDLEDGKEVEELPDGLNLKQLTAIREKDSSLVQVNLNSRGGDCADSPMDYFVFDNYKMTKEYLESTPLSQQIADLYNNVEWERTGVNIGQMFSDIDPEEKVDLSDAKKVKKWLKEKMGEMKSSEDIYIHYVFFEKEGNGYADELYFRIAVDDLEKESVNNYMGLYYVCHASGAGADENWKCCCFSRKENGKYYLFFTHENVFEYRNWSEKDL